MEAFLVRPHDPPTESAADLPRGHRGGARAGRGEGLILHVAHATDLGFDLTEVWESKEQLEAFNRTVFPQAMARAGITMDGPPPPTVEFDPLAVVTARAFTSDARV